MPLFTYICPCGASRRRVRKAAAAGDPLACPECGGAMVRAVAPPGLSVIEEMDNGVQTRRTTRYADADRVWDQHRKSGKSGQA